jgi:hypothetical protein
VEVGGKMRKIKFRVWDKRNKYWHELADVLMDMDGDVYHQYYENLTLLSEDVDVSQAIGLKDKNGKEIHEGDIVSRENEQETVEYTDRAEFYPFGAHDYSWEGKECEVTGNIYENPELIK